MRFHTLLLLAAVPLLAQNAPHWGVQGDYFRGALPGFVVDQIGDLPEKPTIDAKGYQAGLVRFHAKGSPSWAVEFTRMDLTIEGGMNIGPVRQEVRGSGRLRGVSITKYANFFSARWISGGLAFGGGAGQLEASYYRYQVPPGPSVITDRDSVDRWVPTFQAFAQVDVRPVRWVSLSPFYGLRNGMLGGGGAIRIHFTR